MKRAVGLLLVLALVAGAAVMVVSALGASRSTGGGTSSAPTQSDAPLPEPTLAPGSGLARFTGQRIAWKKCQGGSCARVLVPLDYADPDGTTISLTMLKVASRNAEAEPLLVNPGGPGGSGMEYARYARQTLGPTVVGTFDVIGLDPRGVGQSTPIDCVSDKQLDAYLAGDPIPQTPEEVREFRRETREFLQGCRTTSGNLVDHVGTVAAARDLDVVRAVLGQSKLNYFGASYGTKLGATYANLFPERVGKFVLDGAMDPTLGSAEVAAGQAQGFGEALRAWAADYVESCASDCELGSDVPAVLARVDDILTDIEQQPLPASGRELTIGNAFYGVAMPLYNQDYWPLLTDALTDALDGDGTGLLTNSDYYSSRSPRGYTSNSIEANVAINCADDPTGLAPNEVRKQLPRFAEYAGVLGQGLAWGMSGCGGSDEHRDRPQVPMNAAGAAPIVVIGTTRDPATPYAWAVSLAQQLDSGVLVSRDGDGHTGFRSGNDCVDDTVEDFLLDRKVPTSTVNC